MGARWTVREENFRDLLDEYGILRPGGIDAPSPAAAFTVFAQRKDARAEAEAWQRHAAQFFDTELRLLVPKRYDFDPPATDAALVSITAANRPSAIRLCFARPRQGDDLKTADEADVRQGSAGLGHLAKRCRMVWLVATEADEDEVALRVSAILASVVLGPILTPGGLELLGVRSARAKLEAMGGPYR
jgi:hypothetical protein